MRQITRLEIGLLIAVVSLGFGLMYFAYQPRRDAQSASLCRSNLTMISYAMQQYTQDYEDRFPRAWFGRDAGPSDAKTNYKWMDALQPYIKGTDYFVCAADTVSKPYRFRDGTNYGSYVINNAYWKIGDNFSPPTGRRTTDIKQGRTFLVTHGNGDFQVTWPDVKSTPTVTTDWKGQMGDVVYRHQNGRGCTLFCDGSIGYNRLEHEAQIKVINGQRVATAFTIEDD